MGQGPGFIQLGSEWSYGFSELGTGAPRGIRWGGKMGIRWGLITSGKLKSWTLKINENHQFLEENHYFLQKKHTFLEEHHQFLEENHQFLEEITNF